MLQASLVVAVRPHNDVTTGKSLVLQPRVIAFSVVVLACVPIRAVASCFQHTISMILILSESHQEIYVHRTAMTVWVRLY